MGDIMSIAATVAQSGMKISFYASITLIVPIISIYIFHKLERRRRLNIPGIPAVPSPKSSDYRQVLNDANQKYPNQPYIAPFQDPTVIIPAYCIEELKNLPDSHLSTNGSMYDRFAIRWTGSGWVDKELAHSIKYDLPNEVDEFFPTIQDEVQYATNDSLPNSQTWIARPPQEVLVNIVGPVLGRMMVGGPLNRDKKWLKSSIDHALAVVVYSTWLRQFPTVIRPFIAHILPHKKDVQRSKKGIAESIAPLIEKHLGDSEENKASSEEEKGRLTKWVLRRYKPSDNPHFNPSLIERDHYSLCFAAIHGPTFLVVQAIIDLASYPQYVAPLRTEIDRELATAPFEEWTRKTVARMKFVDAFCKESARMNPQGVIGWLRKTHKPITLSTGHCIPQDTLIAATNPRYNARATPGIKDADRFYPERWLEHQEDEGQDANWKFGSATIDSLIFGYGKHACPGRPFGVTMVKDILAYIVGKWDVRLSGGLTERPQNMCMDFIVMPPIAPMGNVEVEFRLRKL